MSDSCAIGVLKKDGQVVSIRVRTGGLPEDAGLALVQSWNSPEKVQELLEDGDRLWLGDNIEEGRQENYFGGSFRASQRLKPRMRSNCPRKQKS